MIQWHLIVFLSSLYISVNGDGEVLFTSSPPALKFQGHDEVDLSTIKDIFSLAMGYSTSQSSEWKGLSIKSPFKFAIAVVGLAIPGVASLGIPEEHHFPLLTDSLLDETWVSVESSVLERYPYAENLTLVHISLDDGKEEAEVNLGKGVLEIKPFSGLVHLKYSIDEHKAFLDQLALLNAVSDKINEKGVEFDGIQDAYWFVLPAYHPLLDIEGEESKVILEAKRLLSTAIRRLTQAYESAYNGRVLIACLASDVKHSRRIRRQSIEASNDTYNWNLAPIYDSDYAPTFNIILWFSIAFTMALIAVSLVIAGMDPGDSIIYRMTSNRMKKEN
uniref:Renin receptor n=1 Tax=Clastoptera arizonana TaxID=38151 RepID=A0A1B6D6Y8_9HEMI